MKSQDHSSMPSAMISSPVALQGSRGSLRGQECVENVRKRLMGGSFMELSDENLYDDDGDCGHFGDKKRRLTFEQVKTLEKSFEICNKLDPERKLQLARALGLQPRQIAVWFQNRRARWKNKQMEKDYDLLKLNYDNLKTNYDNLLQDHKLIKEEIQRLKEEEVSRDGRGSMQVECEEISDALVKQSGGCGTEMQMKRKEVSEKESSFASEGSSVLNVESPRTIDSPQSPHQQNELMMRKSCAEQLDYYHRIPLKVEENIGLNEYDETCCKLFYDYEEQGPMLWGDCWNPEI